MLQVNNQFWVHIKASKVFEFNLLQCELKTQPPILKADSEAIVEIGTAKKSLAIFLNSLVF